MADEYDAMVEDKKTLKDKLGNSPEKIEEGAKKKRGPRKKKTDGLVQTKLDFKKTSPKGKKRTIGSDSEDDVSINSNDSDFETKPAAAPSRERTGRRAATNRKVNYRIDVESDGEKFDSDLELFDNDAVKDEPKQEVVALSDSDDEFNDSKRQPDSSNKSTDELFDSLFENSQNDQNNGDQSSDGEMDEDSDVPIAKKMAADKRKALEDDEDRPKKVKKTKKTWKD